jgi:hypothetical protein
LQPIRARARPELIRAARRSLPAQAADQPGRAAIAGKTRVNSSK